MEIMIVVAIIGLLAAIAIPNLVTARKKAQRQACISTLKAIEGAKANWALDMKKSDSDVPGDQRQACISTLKAIEGAKANWALDMKKSDADVPGDADLFGADKYIETKPLCPAGGTYTLGAVREKPTCSVPDHVL